MYVFVGMNGLLDVCMAGFFDVCMDFWIEVVLVCMY